MGALPAMGSASSDGEPGAGGDSTAPEAIKAPADPELKEAFEQTNAYRELHQALPVEWDDKLAALRVLTDHLTPGRWDALRPMTAKEAAATTVLALTLDDFSVKARTGGTDEPPEDLSWPIWAGQLPVLVGTGAPVAEEGVPTGVPAPIAPRAVGGMVAP